MKYKSIKVYKSTFCRDCFMAAQFFEENNINISETINIDEDEYAAAEVISINNGYRSVPTIVIQSEDDKQIILVEPSWQELTETFK
ncbi:MAG: glutaredoxin family protein [Candidatus Dojkabacteria bacterium]